MNRRGFLRFFGLAPIVAPAAALTIVPKEDTSELGRAIATLADYFRIRRAAGNGTLYGIQFPTTPASDVIVAVGEAKWISHASLSDYPLPEHLRRSGEEFSKQQRALIERAIASR